MIPILIRWKRLIVFRFFIFSPKKRSIIGKKAIKKYP
jgi:hypothetical protein